jgi:hypothetical protein
MDNWYDANSEMLPTPQDVNGIRDGMLRAQRTYDMTAHQVGENSSFIEMVRMGQHASNQQVTSSSIRHPHISSLLSIARARNRLLHARSVCSAEFPPSPPPSSGKVSLCLGHFLLFLSQQDWPSAIEWFEVAQETMGAESDVDSPKIPKAEVMSLYDGHSYAAYKMGNLTQVKVLQLYWQPHCLVCTCMCAVAYACVRRATSRLDDCV